MIKSAVGALRVAATAHGAELPQLPPGTQHGTGITEVSAEEEVESGDVVEHPPLPQRGAEDSGGEVLPQHQDVISEVEEGLPWVVGAERLPTPVVDDALGDDV